MDTRAPHFRAEYLLQQQQPCLQWVTGSALFLSCPVTLERVLYREVWREERKGFPGLSTLLMSKTAVQKGLWDPEGLVLLHPQRKVAPCDLVMKGYGHTAHCQTNPNTVIEILILLPPAISVNANISHTYSYAEEKKKQGRGGERRCPLRPVRSVTEW